MSFHIILNALIILFILHVFLQNIQFNQIIGEPKRIIQEHFGKQLGVPDSPKEEAKKIDYQKSIQFLQSDDDSSVAENDDEFKKKLLSMIGGDSSLTPSQKQFEKKNVLPVLPSNSFTSDKNTPNFESNVLNVQKFYTKNDVFDNLDASELKTSIENYTNERSYDNTVLKATPIPNLSNDVNDSKSSFGRIATENPPTWSYKSELPMNGGDMGGIVGFDSLESQFSMYESGVMNKQKADSPNFKMVPHDDLRKPIIYEN